MKNYVFILQKGYVFTSKSLRDKKVTRTYEKLLVFLKVTESCRKLPTDTAKFEKVSQKVTGCPYSFMECYFVVLHPFYTPETGPKACVKRVSLGAARGSLFRRSRVQVYLLCAGHWKRYSVPRRALGISVHIGLFPCADYLATSFATVDRLPTHLLHWLWTRDIFYAISLYSLLRDPCSRILSAKFLRCIETVWSYQSEKVQW